MPLLKRFSKGNNPASMLFTQFQTPAAVIFQNLFIDAPNNFRHKQYSKLFVTWGIYALIGVAVGAFRDEPEDRFNPKHRTVDAFNGWLYSVPMIGGKLCNAVESFSRTGKIRPSFGGNFPAVDSTVRTVNALSDEEWSKAISNFIDAMFYATGLPAASKRDIERAWREKDWKRILGMK